MCRPVALLMLICVFASPTLLAPQAEGAADEAAKASSDKSEKKAPEVPEDPDAPLTVVRARKAITVSGKEIENAVIVIAEGRIRDVGRGLEYPKNAAVIDARDRVVTPGLIAPKSRMNLPAVARTGVHGDFTVAAEFFPSDREFEEALAAGYTALALEPGGTDVPGRAIVVRTGGPRESRVLKSPSYLRVAPDKKAFRQALERAKKEIEKIDKAREEFEKKQEAAAKEKPATQPASTQPATQPAATQPTTKPAFEPPPVDPKLRPLVDLLEKKEGAFALIDLNNASDFEHFAELLEEFEIAHVFALSHFFSTDFELVASKLGERKARVVMLPVITNWTGTVEKRNLPRMFAGAGCEVSMRPLTDSGFEAGRVRVRMAELVKTGFKRDDAIKSLTLNPAKLLGLDAQIGAIEKGRDADLVFFDGDPLDPASRVREVMIRGQIVHRTERDGAGAYRWEDRP